eukprot:5227969-Prorocentrum_lima.AAC.1
MAVKLGCAMEPRVIMQVLSHATEEEILTDYLLTRTWWDRVSDLTLRNPQGMVDVMMCVRIVTG